MRASSSFKVIAAALLCSGFSSFASASSYQVESLSNAFSSSPNFIGNKGGVAGTLSQYDSVTNVVYWDSAGNFTNITPSDSSNAFPIGIDDNDAVYYADAGRFYVWNAGAITDLGAGYPSAANSKGQLAGSFGSVFGVWTNGVVAPLPLPAGATYAYAYDISENGNVAGFAYYTGTNVYLAVAWINGQPQLIGSLPGDVKGFARAINAAGQVVGYSYSSTNKSHAFVWENGVISDLGFASDVISFATGINDSGQIVGGFVPAGSQAGHPFISQNGTTTDLAAVAGNRSCSLVDINAQGQLVGGCAASVVNAPVDLRFTPVTNVADVSVAISASLLPATVGLPLTFTTTVVNTGDVAATNVALTQSLPAGAVAINSITTTQGACSGTATVSCAFGDLAGGASAVVTIVATPLSTGSDYSYYDLTAAVSADSDINALNNNDQLRLVVYENKASLSVYSSNSQTSATKGGTITYKWVLSNSGPKTANNVVLTDKLPSSVALVSVNTTAGTCGGTTTITCNLGDLRYGGGPTITIVVKALSRGTVTNSATVTSTTPDPTLSDNTATVVTRVK